MCEHYEIHAPEFGVLHPMVCIAKAQNFEQATYQFEKAKLRYLYVDLVKVTTTKEVVKKEWPGAHNAAVKPRRHGD
ncbi:MAG TPA: hypothetical protein VJ396_09220 [Acidiferrobacterales bacterium]|nr:hypothetical protein [Acidiferrobacterales bacterium]